MIGQQISPILEEIENALWEFEADNGSKPNFSINGFSGGIKIFMAVLMDKIWELQEADNMPQSDREKMAETVGQEVRKLIKIYTNIDAPDLYK